MGKLVLGKCPAIGRDDICTAGLAVEYCANKECAIKEAIRNINVIKSTLDVVEVDDDE